MVFSSEVLVKILGYYFDGRKPPSIEKLLREQDIWKLLRRYERTGTIARQGGGGRRGFFTPEVKGIVDEQMNKDDETTAYQLHKLLLERGMRVSISSVLRYRRALGWTYRGSAYCQLIREINKQKRLAWAKQYLNEAEDGFDDVIWSDESSIQCDTHKRFCYRKKKLFS